MLERRSIWIDFSFLIDSRLDEEKIYLDSPSLSCSFQPLALVTAFSQPANILVLFWSSISEVNTCLPLALTFSRVFGSLTSHPKSPTAEAARSADPRAVDLREKNGKKRKRVNKIFRRQMRRARDPCSVNSLSHLRSLYIDSENVSLNLHGFIRVSQTSIDLKSFEWNSTIFLHSVQDDFGLETNRFQSGTSKVPLVCESSQSLMTKSERKRNRKKDQS